MILQITLTNPVQAHAALTKTVWPRVKAETIAGHELVCQIVAREDKLTEAQRRYYHGFVLMEIAKQAAPGGQKFSMKVWKEYYREKFLGYKRVTTTNPITGRKSRKRVRVSTEDLSVKKYTILIEKVCADAATEHGVQFGLTQDEFMATVDPDTGEIQQ